MNKYVILFLTVLVLAVPNVYATSGYCKITNQAGQVGYWKFDSQALCTLVNDLLDVQTEWIAFTESITLQSVEGSPNFCDGWKGECAFDVSNQIISLGSSSPSSRIESRESTCTESWQCTAWSECSNGEKSRTCTEVNACGTKKYQPEQTINCEESTAGNNVRVLGSDNNGNASRNTFPKGSLLLLTSGIIILAIILLGAAFIYKYNMRGWKS